MNYLILVRHSIPVIQQAVRPSRWKLSYEGIERSHQLAKLIAPLQPDFVISSPEDKALQTGAILAQELGILHTTDEDIREHQLGTGIFLSASEFDVAVKEFFEHPDQKVFGIETANGAQKRFLLAVERIIDKYRQSNIVLVTHGRILCLFISQVTGLRPYAFWQKLEMPAFAVFRIPGLEMVQLVNKVKLVS